MISTNVVSCLYLVLFAIEMVASNDVVLLEQSLADITASLPDASVDPADDLTSTLLKEMCQRQAGPEFVNRSEVASMNLQICAVRVVLSKPVPSGPVNEGVKPMCDRFEAYKGCISKYLSDLDICFAENEKWAPPLLQNLTETIINFMCEDDGRNTIQFLDRGPECVHEKQEALGTCTKMFLTETINVWGFAVNGTGTASAWKGIELKDCKILRQYRKCTLEQLTTCANLIPATIVDKVFALIERFTSCDKYAPCEIDPQCNNETRWSTFKKSQS